MGNQKQTKLRGQDGKGGLLIWSAESQLPEMHGWRVLMNLLSLQIHGKSEVEQTVLAMDENAQVVYVVGRY